VNFFHSICLLDVLNLPHMSHSGVCHIHICVEFWTLLYPFLCNIYTMPYSIECSFLYNCTVKRNLGYSMFRNARHRARTVPAATSYSVAVCTMTKIRPFREYASWISVPTVGQHCGKKRRNVRDFLQLHNNNLIYCVYLHIGTN
jgi:hypothetical protein